VGIVVTLHGEQNCEVVENISQDAVVLAAPLSSFLIYLSTYCKQEGSYDSFALAKPAFDQIVLPTTPA
jgi:hypothetical protein